MKSEEKKNMDNFNWVQEYSTCSLAIAFEKLKLQVERDVETRNIMRRPEPTRGDTSKFAYRFDTVSNSASFKVVLSSVEHHEVVTFRLGAKSISATDTNGDEMFEATLTLNDEGDCRFKIKGQEQDFWHVRRMALEHLFFGIC